MAARTLNVLSLCTGIAGLDLGLRAATDNAARVVCMVEREAYCASVLAARMQTGHLEPAPIWNDVTTFDAAAWRGCIDIITAGYPCQPFSHAGRRQGEADPRHLWPFIAAHVRTIQPAFVFCENVPGHLSLGFEQVCCDLQEMGYGVAAGLFSAQESGALHIRQRLFFIAHANSHGVRLNEPIEQAAGRPASELEQHGDARPVADADSARCACGRCAQSAAGLSQGGLQQSKRHCAAAHVADADGRGRRGGPGERQPDTKIAAATSRCAHDKRCACTAVDADGAAVPNLDGAFDGVAKKLDSPWPDNWDHGVPRVVTNMPLRAERLRAIGNAVVPATAELAWRTLYQQIADGQDLVSA